MDRLLLKGVLHDGRTRNILIGGKRFLSLDAPADVEDAIVIEADGLAILPAFYNTHTHAAMNLLRGYADDMPLKKWLTEYIWPYEDTLGPKEIRKGSEMAVREMLSTGTVFFSDMYFEIQETMDVVNKAGMRAAIGITVMDNHSLAVVDEKLKLINTWKDPSNGHMSLVMAPHAIYTVGPERMQSCTRIAREKGMKIHLHLSETASEVKNCIKEHGTTPIKYLDSLGILGPDVIAAHCVHVDKEEWDILAERGVTVAHCPCSNMKLGSGRFPYELAIASGARITLGTDGSSSNNNLDMREEMKFAALLAKVKGDPVCLPDSLVFRWATVNGAEAFGIDAGVIAEGKLADFLLVDLHAPKMEPCHNLISNWVYAADTGCIRKVFCDGREVWGR